MQKGKKIGFALVAMGFSLVLALLAGELLARIVAPQREIPRWFVVDKDYGYFHRRNFKQVYQYQASDVTWLARFNELGLRGPAYGGPRAGERRVLCLGDSFTFGYGLDEEKIFPTKLERQLNAQGGGNWRVINAGVGGWGALQETKYARAHFDLFRPDVVVLTVCDNDANDDRLFSQGRSSGLLPGFPGKRWLRDHSNLYRILYAAVADRLYTKALDRRDELPARDPGLRPAAMETDPAVLEKIYTSHRALWATTLEAIESFRRDYLAFNPEGLLLVQMAQPYRVDLHFLLKSLDNGRDLFFIDMLPDAWRIGEANWLLPYDPHWTEDVHDLSAGYLAEAIRRHAEPAPAAP